jgi:hypothetical protein
VRLFWRRGSGRAEGQRKKDNARLGDAGGAAACAACAAGCGMEQIFVHSGPSLMRCRELGRRGVAVTCKFRALADAFDSPVSTLPAWTGLPVALTEEPLLSAPDPCSARLMLNMQTPSQILAAGLRSGNRSYCSRVRRLMSPAEPDRQTAAQYFGPSQLGRA